MGKNGKHFWDQGNLSLKHFREQLILLMGSKGKSKTIKGKHVPPSSGRDSTSVAVLL